MPREPVSDSINQYVKNLLGESTDPDLQKFNFVARLFSWVSFPFLLFLFFYFLATIGHRVIWDKIMRPMFLRCFKDSKYFQPSESDKPSTDQIDFSAALKNDKWVGPTSYNVAKMDEYVAKVASYRAGGDGGHCLKILKAYIGNITKNPDDVKYRKINMENKAYKTKVKPFLGAKNLLLCVGFVPTKDGTGMELAEDAGMDILKMAEEKVDAAYEKYMK
jgi:hypothetical protein